MTPTLTSLTDDQKNSALATASGICAHPRSARRSETVEDGNSYHTDYWCDICKEDPHRTPAPDYLTDLNAVHEFEKTLTEEQADSYQNAIAQGYSDVDDFDSPAAYYWYHATARQRVDALLLALNLATK